MTIYHIAEIAIAYMIIKKCLISKNRLNLLISLQGVIADSLEAAYSLNWGAREIWGKGGGETLPFL